MHFTTATIPSAPAQPLPFNAFANARAQYPTPMPMPMPMARPMTMPMRAPPSPAQSSSSDYSSSSHSSGSSANSSSSSSEEGGAYFAPGAKARVVWVGNVKSETHRDELKTIFTLALGDELVQQGYRVAHIRVQKQRRMPFNSATVFFNRSVHLEGLAHRLRFKAKQPLLTIRKCTKKAKMPKKAPGFKHAWGAPAKPTTALQYVANESAAAYVQQLSTPLPAEVGFGSQPLLDFMRMLDEQREPMDMIFSLPLLAHA